MTDDQVCCMVWINGLRDNTYSDIRTKALQVMEAKPECTLLELEQNIKRLLDVRADSKSVCKLEPKSSEINAISTKETKRDKPQKAPPSPCYKCGGNHWAKECQKQVTCHLCKKDGHIAKFCRTKKRETDQKGKNNRIKSVMVRSASTFEPSRIYRIVTINGTKIQMQMDTGADVTLISTKDWNRLGRPQLQAPTIQVKSANHQPIKVRGSFQCNFVINGNVASGQAHVAETGTLLGTDWISKDPTLWKTLNQQICAVSSDVGSACDYLDNTREQLKSNLEKEFNNVFQPGLGKCTKTKASILLKPGAQPVFRKARPVPFAALTTVSEELERLQQSGVISPVDHSEWAAPIVLVKKKNGSIRMCSDFSTGLNDSIQQHQHPLPTADDIFATLNGGKYFSQIDLAEAYLQIEIDDQAKQMLCINTHRGLFSYNRLPFGVKSAPGCFQQVMDAMITGLDGAAVYLDDIIITGSTIEEHNSRLKSVFKRIDDYGFRVRLEKCTFLMPRITFLGFCIDKDGRRPDPEKVTAIQQMPEPKNDSQVRSFLGLIQFYGTFIKELFKFRPPLDALTKKDAEFKWTSECQSSFDNIKQMLQSDLLLTHYDPKLPIIVAADACQYGIGAVISHRFPDGSEKAIYHISKALTAPQRNYSQIEKEVFGLITAVTKFHKFIHGRHFTLKTDHKPLLSIFGEKKGIPIYSANRLQRWATIL
ncbi:Protein CBG27950 [Caenorhabditis briggsae]|uniref:RNA-directed DNA polymerase n=1 Tax=Caenorhabditis briggsae TaxID=6238 RepID=B6IJP2_CAEBR|nr:Protein CBG27950 [Caenorhabditis briggsae]CAS00122.1 Protein CBG27950 [Caenorhabditis briggsae]